MRTGGFLNAEDIRTLINANTDENATHFVFMTVHGTIFGHDKDQDIKDIRKFGAFTGTTWLRHDKAIAETGQASTEPDFGLNGKTLKVVISKDGKSLHSMIVQVDDMISAISYVKEETLLAAQLEKQKFLGEIDEIATMFLDSDANKGDNADVKETDGGKDEGKTSPHDVEDLASKAESLTVSEESKPEDVDTKGEIPTDKAAASSSSPPASKLSKIRILEVRAEAMAKEFAEEICGPEFRMPPDFR